MSTVATTTSKVIPEYHAATARVSPLRGALIQAGAIFVDAYRELNHRKMFWIVLIISAVVVAAFAAVGLNQKGITIFGWELEFPFNTNIISRGEFYKLMFNTLGVGFWLSWAATILALISTAGIFPDMLTGGAIDLYLSKPISRLRLFLTKYLAALLFVTLQVGLFTLASFVVLGIRGGTWLWGLFITIPIMVVFFSYLYSMCALLGVLTRSTLAALLLTMLLWFGIAMLNNAESILLMLKIQRDHEITMVDRQIVGAQRRVQRLEAAATTGPTTVPATAVAAQPATTANAKSGSDFTSRLQQWGEAIVRKQQEAKTPQVQLQEATAELDRLRTERAGMENKLTFWHKLALGVKTVLPKTSETIGVLNRGLKYYAEMGSAQIEEESAPQVPAPSTGGNNRHRRHDEDEVAEKEFVHVVHSRSLSWVIGTSLGFEALMLGIAAIVFVRRDF